MAIGYSDNIRSQMVQICTPELLHQALKSNRVKTVCAQLADALESKLRGEICNDDYEEMKKKLKSQLPILTPHATFRNGRRKNDEAIPAASRFMISTIFRTPEDIGKRRRMCWRIRKSSI